MLSGLMFVCVGYFWRRTPALVLRLPARKAAVLAGMLTALIYALVAGFAVPTQRTLYMLTIFGLALWTGRQLVLSQVLSLALFIVVLLDPWAVISAGFWLSFGAVAILSYALGGRIGKTHWLRASLQSQWAVTVGMVPLLLVMFNQFSIVSPVANAIAIPLISLVVTPLALLGTFLPLDFVLQFSYEVLDICMSLLGWLNRLPDVVWQQYAPPLWTLIPGLIGILWLLLPRGTPARWLGYFGLLPMLLVTPVRQGFAEMKVSVLDVGQGLSVVVQTATHTLLYDAGGKYSEQADAGSRIILPYLRGEGIRKLDGFVVSHDDSDHSGGMSSVLAQMPLGWLSSSLPESSVKAIKQHTIKPRTTKCVAGQKWQWDGVNFEMLYPELESYEDISLKDNNRSCVLKITSASGSLLLAGDIEKQAELVLIAKQQGNQNPVSLKSEVLIAPHHGSKTSSSEEFIAAVSPDWTIFTAGYLNRFRHPLPEIVRRYENASSKVLRSDYHGAVILHYTARDTDNPMQVVNWRKQHQRYWHDRYR